MSGPAATNPWFQSKGKKKTELEELQVEAAARAQKVERERIRRLIITLGDDGSKKVLGQIKGLVGALEDDIELHGDLIADTALECAKWLPLKSTIIAAWIGRMAEKHPAWASAFVTKVLEALKATIRAFQYSHAQLLLQFLVSLGSTGTLGLGALMDLLGEVMAMSDGLRPSKGGDLGVFLALAALLFLSPAAHSLVSERVAELMALARPYVAARDARWKPLLRVLKGEDLPDRLEALMAAATSQERASWTAQVIQYVPGFQPSLEGKAGMPPLSPLGITAQDVRKGLRLQVPLISSRILTRTLEGDGADDQMSEHDRWVLEDYLLLTIEMFGKDLEECSKQILRIPVLHPHFEAITVETIFSQMLRLPSPPQLPLFYIRLLEAIGEKQHSCKELISKAFNALLEKAADLDEESLEVLSEAFALHLVHSDCQADWKPCLSGDMSVQAQRLLRRSLERLQRLSFHQNLLHKLPEAIHVYVPPEPQALKSLPSQARPEFQELLTLVKIKDADANAVQEFCERLMRPEHKEDDKEATAAAAEEEPAAKRRRLEDGEEKTAATGGNTITSQEGAAGGKRKQPDGVKEEVKQEAGDEANAGLTDAKEAADRKDEPRQPLTLQEVVELLVVALLQQGEKTPTHMSKLLEGYKQVVLALKPSEAELAHSIGRAIVRCVFEFWRFSGQRLEITVDALLQHAIVTPQQVVDTALADRREKGCDSISVWNIVNTVARKSLERTQSIRSELEIAKRLEKEDVLEKARKQLDVAIRETAELFTLIFAGLVRNHSEFKNSDNLLQHITQEKVFTIGRKYHAFIKPVIDTAKSRIPGAANDPEIAAIFQSLSALS